MCCVISCTNGGNTNEHEKNISRNSKKNGTTVSEVKKDPCNISLLKSECY